MLDHNSLSSRALINASLGQSTTNANNLGFVGGSRTRTATTSSHRIINTDGTVTQINLAPATLTDTGEIWLAARSNSATVGYLDQTIGMAFVGTDLSGALLQSLRTLTLAFNTAVR